MKNKDQPQNSNDADVIIVGGGPAGLTMAAMLAANNVGVICIDRETPADQAGGAFDGRTIAISYGSRKILDAAGIWNDLLPFACPINTIQIIDGNSPVLLEFDSEEAGGKTFGWIAEMRIIRKSMFNRLDALPLATHLAPSGVRDFSRDDDDAVSVHLDNGDILRAPLIIGADGRKSFTREWMGIHTRNWSYHQKAIVCTTIHENPHNNFAIENFHAQGPFAILPMTDNGNGEHRSSIVWTEHANKKHSAADYNSNTFNAALNARFPDSYGSVRQIEKRFSYLLGLVHAHKYIAPRMALIADAAHGIHPIAGQGLNLGFRDITALANLIINAKKQNVDVGSDTLLHTYQRQRRFDNIAMASSTDLLTKLFSNNIAPVSMARKAGLRALSKLPVAKTFLIRQAMGLSGGSSGILPALIRRDQS